MKLFVLFLIVVICITTVGAWFSVAFGPNVRSLPQTSSTALFSKLKKVRGKRIPDRSKNLPRKIKRTLNTMSSLEFQNITAHSELESYIKYTATKGVKHTLFKRLEKTARKLNVVIPDTFGHLSRIDHNPLPVVLENAGNYSLFLQALQIGELTEFANQRNITALIPRDDIITDYLTNQLHTTPETFFADKEQVVSFVKQHVLPGYITLKKLKRFTTIPLPNFAGAGLKVKEEKTENLKLPLYLLQGANILKSDWKVDNGIIHVIDKMFFPLATPA